MRIEFPLREIKTEFGPLLDPTIELQVKTTVGYRRFRFFLDTGADFSMMPNSAAELLGLNLDEAQEREVTGIEGSKVSVRLGSITLKMGVMEATIPCLFSSIESMPFLLGRMGIFDRFNIVFDNQRKRVILESFSPEAKKNLSG